MQPAHIHQWGISGSGQNLELFHHDDLRGENEGPILIVGGVHGDEPEGVALAESLLDWILKPEVLSSQLKPWILVPCLNPDGYAAKTRVNHRGVDLNRNYPSTNWSAEFENERYQPGPFAGSEPEISSMVQLISATRPRVIIHLHSWKPMIILTGNDPTGAAKQLSESSGYPLKNEVGYPTPGSLSFYGWNDLKIPIICVEEAEGASPEESWARFGPAFKKILQLNLETQK